MRVLAVQVGFYGGSLRRIGDIFEMAESVMEKDVKGAPVLPTWVEVAPADEAEAQQFANSAREEEAKKNKAGALAASGGTAAKDKADATQDLV